MTSRFGSCCCCCFFFRLLFCQPSVCGKSRPVTNARRIAGCNGRSNRTKKTSQTAVVSLTQSASFRGGHLNSRFKLGYGTYGHHWSPRGRRSEGPLHRPLRKSETASVETKPLFEGLGGSLSATVACEYDSRAWAVSLPEMGVKPSLGRFDLIQLSSVLPHRGVRRG